MTRSLRCPGCKTEALIAGGTVGDDQKQSGYTAFFDVRGSVHYVCPTCVVTVREAADQLRAVFGKDLSYVHMTGVARLLGEL